MQNSNPFLATASRTLIVLFLLILPGHQDAIGQSTTAGGGFSTAIGFHAGYVSSWHETDFTSPDGKTGCGCVYTGARSDGYALGVSGVTVLDERWRLEASAAIRSSPVRLTSPRTVATPIRYGPGIEIRTVVDEQPLETSLTRSQLDVTVQYTVIGGLRLTAGAGMAIAGMKDATLRQTIVSLDGLQVEDESRLVWAGQIDAVRKTSFAVIGGAQYTLPFSPGFGSMIILDLRYAHSLTDIMRRDASSDPKSGLRWRVHDLQAGMRVLFPIR